MELRAGIKRLQEAHADVAGGFKACPEPHPHLAVGRRLLETLNVEP